MKIFWSWQSDTPGKTGRHFIRDALDKAVAALKRDSTLLEPSERDAIHVDQDRQGISGSRDLFPEIVKKIVASDVFIADVTPVGIIDPALGSPDDRGNAKKFINSNVAIELGYAFQAVTDAFVLLVLNNHYGGHEELPFDLRHKGGTIAFTLAPDASSEERKRIAKVLARRLEDEIKLCLSAKVPASAPTELLAIGPDIVCRGELVGFDKSEWRIHIREFLVGDVNTLMRYVEGFEEYPSSQRYVTLNAMGEGRQLTSPPNVTKEGNGFVVRCSIASAVKRISAQQMPRDFAISPITGDLHIEGRDIATVKSEYALPQRIRSALSLIQGESPFYPLSGSRLQEYYWRFRDKPWLEQLFKLEVVRLAAIPFDEVSGEKRTPLLCVEHVQAVTILASEPADGWLPIGLELDVKGLGIWPIETQVVMPPADKVRELSVKGASFQLGLHGVQPSNVLAPPKVDRQITRNRKRLSVITETHSPGGLKLEVRYQPESLHIGLSARVSLLEPPGAVLRPGVAHVNPAPTLQGYVIYKLGEPSANGVATIRLRQDMRASKTTVMAVVYLVPSDASNDPITIARVRLEIVTDEGELVAENELAVSSLR